MDNFSECPSCKQHLSCAMWIQVHKDIRAAMHQGSGGDFLSSILMPRPGLVKVTLCYGCSTFKPTADLTPDEVKYLTEYTKQNQATAKAGQELGKLFGFFN